MAFNKDGYLFVVSPGSTKKYKVYKNNKFITSFGGVRKNGKPYEQFFDKIGYYKKYNHLDNNRKNLYYKRHGRNAKFESAKWFSHRYLW